MKENLLLLWGWTRDEHSYENLVSTSPSNWDVSTISYEQLMPGGRPDRVNEIILNFLEERGLKRVNLMGHSLGGALALEFAYHHPEKVSRLFLVDSEGVYGHETLKELIGSFLKAHSRKVALSENLRALYRTLRKPILHAKLAHFAHHANLEEQAKGIKVPTIILWGENDRLTPLKQGERLHELIPESKFLVLEGMDHDWVLHSAKKFWENI